MRDQNELFISNLGRRHLKNLNAKRRRLLARGLPTCCVAEEILQIKNVIATLRAGHKKLLEWWENRAATNC